MKITYVTTYDANDVKHWSGTGHFAANALRAQGCELDLAGPLPEPRAQWPLRKAKGLVYNRLLHKRYHPGHDLRRAHYYAEKVRTRMSQAEKTDIVFSPGVVPVAFLECEQPIAFWSDATHAALFNFYSEYTGLCAETEQDGNAIEQAALNRCAAAIFSSDWAAQSAIRDYGADPEKVHVVPFGANLSSSPAESDILTAIESRSTKRCHLLHIGVDWERKGGPIALQTAAELNRIGLPTQLTIIGCNPFHDTVTPWFVRCEGFLNKQVPSERARLNEILAQSHFLIVPSQAECYGLVYCEASAFGIPSLARATGGVSTIIQNDVNGKLFAPSSPAAAYVQAIESLFSNTQRYRDLARSSYQRYVDHLNWDVAGRRVRRILDEIIEKPRQTPPSPAGDELGAVAR